MKDKSKPDDFTLLREGILFSLICTSLPIEEATDRMNRLHPAGTEHGWMLSERTEFRHGEPHPCACQEHPETHKHYLMVC